jgi:hypothetical protein
VTATLLRPGTAVVPPAPATRRSAATAWTLLVGAVAVGTLVVGLSYRAAAQGAAPNVYYGLFWVGTVTAMLPVAVRTVRHHLPAGERWLLLLLLGFVTWLPKFLRNPSAPSYHDEYAHWRQLLDVLADGRLFHPNNQIPIIQYFPGTSALTAGIARITGLGPWTSGLVLLGVTHLLVLAGVFVLAQVHLGTARAGGIAALVYALNPSEVYFDTQYAYEGVALAFLVWAVVFASLAARSAGPRRTALVASALVAAAGMIVTHHLSTVFLLLLLLLVAVVTSVRRGSQAGTWWVVLGGVALLAAGWIALVARPTLVYLEPYLGGSITQLGRIRQGSGTGRVLLQPSVQPLWERVLTAAAPVVIAGVVLLGAWLLLPRRGVHHRRRIRLLPLVDLRSDTLALMAYGLVYFPSVLFLLAPSGAEGARRSWGFTYLGLAVVVAYACQRIQLRHTRNQVIAALLFAVVLIGNVGAGLNDPYRFPGPFRWGTDTRSASAEARAVAVRLAADEGRVRVVADRYTGMQLSGYGGLWNAAPSAGFPAWALVQTDQDPSPELAAMLTTSHYEYLVVDTRMTDEPSYAFDNYGRSDPLLGQATPTANLARLDHVPWAEKIMSTDHLRVYRLDLALIGTPLEGAQ